MSDEKEARRYKLICLLATGCSNREAADQMGTSVSTIERMRQGIDFKGELSEAVNQVYRNNLLKLTLGMTKATSELLRIIESSDTPDRVKLKAIEILFGQTLNLDCLVIEDRLNELEEQIRLRDIQQPFYDDWDASGAHPQLNPAE
jgi:transposase